jgi:hypothetical protein
VYLPSDDTPQFSPPKKSDESINKESEIKAICSFLEQPCKCGKNCQLQFTEEELLKVREDFRNLSLNQKNCFILSQLNCFHRSKSMALSGRVVKSRTRQKFDYRINADRPVCRETFLFYYGETLWRLKSLQKHLQTTGIKPPVHGNTGREPIHALSFDDEQYIELFITNYAVVHGLPDPGRDLRTGKGKLRVLLPSVMTYQSIHKEYELCMTSQGKRPVSYNSFVQIWHKKLPHIDFIKPRTDLCMKCEEYKKALNQVAADLKDRREDEKIRIHNQAIEHLRHAKLERDYYRSCIEQAEKQYKNLPHQQKTTNLPNSKAIVMHYSWDFAQHVWYPYEDQQVGPIYFKTARKAHLFGVCCEAISRQVNYLIDEGNFIEKNAATVISLLDHFFATYGLGEKHVQLTADNCVAQNKNNALLQYLMYRVLMGLHDRIDFSFMIVGHTKFAPDGYFGLISSQYRRSKVYTYNQMADIIDCSTNNKHNISQRYYEKNGEPAFVYRDWSNWLLKYFKKLPNLTKYHHFTIDKNEPGIVIVKQTIDGLETKHNLLKKPFPYGPNKIPRCPRKLKSSGISLERAWYLYNNIREHIPNEEDKDSTCPKPNRPKPS